MFCPIFNTKWVASGATLLSFPALSSPIQKALSSKIQFYKQSPGHSAPSVLPGKHDWVDLQYPKIINNIETAIFGVRTGITI
jgi:hypothetical protein